jgi:FtsH-binding integral membrane protein
VFEGIFLGLVIESYVARGMGSVVMNAASTTGALVFVLGAYSWTTKRDLTGMSGFLMAGLLGIIVAGLIGFFIPMGTMFHLVISALTAVVFSGFIMVDLQRLRSAEGEMHDAIWFAVSIYLDIFNLFLAILRLFGLFNGSDD